MHDAVQAAERARAAALVERDLEALTPWLDDALVYVHATGVRHDRPAYLQYVSEGPRFVAVDLKPAEIDVRGAVALVTGVLDLRFVRPGDTSETLASSWACAVWLQAGRGWRLRCFQSTRRAPSHD